MKFKQDKTCLEKAINELKDVNIKVHKLFGRDFDDIDINKLIKYCSKFQFQIPVDYSYFLLKKLQNNNNVQLILQFFVFYTQFDLYYLKTNRRYKNLGLVKKEI